MHEWDHVKTYLEKHNIAQEDVALVKEFLRSLNFVQRQQLMGILLGWPDKIGLFVEVLKKKHVLAQTQDENLAQEIFDLEQKEVTNLMKEINP